jgi:hypothetical protein
LLAVGDRIVAVTNETHKDVVGDAVLDLIDPATNSVAFHVPVGSYAHAAAGDGQLWVGTGTALERIDPSTGETTFSADSTDGAAAVGNGAVWGYHAAQPELTGADPVTGKTAVSIDLPGSPIGLALSPGAVWVLNYDGTLTRVDVSSN